LCLFWNKITLIHLCLEFDLNNNIMQVSLECPLWYLCHREVNSIHIYLIELEIEDTINTARPASYLGIPFEFDSDLQFKKETLRQKRLFNFSHLYSIYIEHFSSTCIWSIYLSVDPIFLSLWFLSWFPWTGLVLTSKVLNQGFLVVKLKSSLVSRSSPWPS
jgi:hypothetical protein